MYSEKHAYLIAAHHQMDLLKVLLSLLDDEKNDIYLHVDSRCRVFNESEMLSTVRKSKLFFIERRKVAWGGYSQIQLEFDLLHAATKNGYAYYHLISGVDLPIKSQEYIHVFFEKHKGQEFISFDYDQNIVNFKNRLDVYHVWQEQYGNKKNLLYKADRFIQLIQKQVGVHRLKSIPYNLKKGANWFSITHELATYVLEKEIICRKIFKKTRCCDEVFLQTLVFNSPFKERLYFSEHAKRYYNMRYVDFKRGNPYVFTRQDYDEIMSREELFARKFDIIVDRDIINEIRNTFLKERRV